MDRLNGAHCIVYSNNGIYKGNFLCVIQVDSQELGDLMNAPLGNSKKVKIIVKNMRESLKNCKLTIFNNVKGKFYVLDNYVVKTEGYDDEDIWANDDDENIISKIKEITKEQYEKLKTKAVSNIEWDKIKTCINGENMSADKVFEYLCVDLINKIKIAKEGAFHPRGGTDGGRDYIWKWASVDDTSIDYLDLPDDKWIMQCKYSKNPKQKLEKTEIWDEIVKVIQYNPNHYIVFTNRQITTSFKDWWDGVSKLDARKSKFIPFSLHMVGREDIEKLLNLWQDVKEKYFE